MINWTFNEKDFKINENTNNLIPEGDHRVRVNKVTIKTYSSGNEGFEIMLDVSGYPNKLWHRIILNSSNPEKTNHHIGKFLESFNITDYDLNHYEDWVGKDGAVRVKHDNYEGNISAKVIFCITRAYQGKLPGWRDVCYDKSDDSTVKRSVPSMPNEFVSNIPQAQHRKFDGFSF